ncbi:MAG: alpha/beta hydrolase, partial [Phycisphaerales bacterium]|nr:alpha/beta hydrolase [Phycisphaerales bacterium]
FAVSIEYRLGGEAPFPAALEDCFDAIRFLKANAGELGIDSTRIGVVGYSSGGHLAALMATGGSGEVRYENSKGAEVSWAGIISGPVMPAMLQGQVRKMFRRWVGGEESGRSVSDASPATWIDDADPPFFLLCGADDDVVPSVQSESFHSHLRQAGVDSVLQVIPGARHVISDRSAFQEMLRSLDEHLGGHAAISEQ